MVSSKRTFHGEQPVIEVLHPNQAETETALSAALAAAGGIDASDIQVIRADDGIHLRGTVMSTEELEKCLHLARSTGQPVINELTVHLPRQGG